MATQNPIEQEGTYPLPEAQVDRFLLKVVIGYPTREDEKLIIRQNIAPVHHQVHALLKVLISILRTFFSSSLASIIIWYRIREPERDQEWWR